MQQTKKAPSRGLLFLRLASAHSWRCKPSRELATKSYVKHKAWLKARGHSFAHYADDCNVDAGSHMARQRVMPSLGRQNNKLML